MISDSLSTQVGGQCACHNTGMSTLEVCGGGGGGEREGGGGGCERQVIIRRVWTSSATGENHFF